MEPSEQNDNKVPTEGYVWGDEEVTSEQLPIGPSSSEPGTPGSEQLPIQPRNPNNDVANPEEELPIQ